MSFSIIVPRQRFDPPLISINTERVYWLYKHFHTQAAVTDYDYIARCEQ